MAQLDTYKALYEECRLLVLGRNYPKALEKLTQLINEFPDQPDPLLLKANTLLLIRGNDMLSPEEQEALFHGQQECIQQALELEPDHVPALTDMADFLANNLPLNSKNISLVLSYYDKALNLLAANKYWTSLKDETEFAYVGKAQFLKKIGKSSEAQKCLQEGLQLYPESTLLFEELG